MPKKQTGWSRAYNEKAYDRLAITIPKGRKKDIENRLREDGRSINGLVNELLRDYLGMDPGEWRANEEAPGE